MKPEGRNAMEWIVAAVFAVALMALARKWPFLGTLPFAMFLAGAINILFAAFGPLFGLPGGDGGWFFGDHGTYFTMLFIGTTILVWRLMWNYFRAR
jgi:hypothetical protein